MKKKTKKYHTVRTVPKQRNTTLSEQFQNKEIPHCQNSSKTKKYHTVRTVPKQRNTTLSEQFQNKEIPLSEQF
jgi:hypothetical protein